ncbi:MAG: N-acetylmuramoyl-L-alanine amidase, partial [Pseudomonadota bacterium]|nr:N-acetylmuramoyl-L-alanine amidase [Pseudomonadota bacterium]
MVELIAAPSPNFDARRAPPDMLVLHYTGMETGEAALARLRDPEAKVSAHYLVEEDGRIFQLVPEERRAWHAGRGVWRGEADCNAVSIGIEIVNPGHEWGYRPFPQAQTGALIPLMHDIVQRHGITRGNIVGHSDVAPARKQDPGELFPWGQLARLRLALPRPTRNLMDPLWTDSAFLLAL